MFYLKFLGLHFRKNPFRTFAFVLSSAMLFFLTLTPNISRFLPFDSLTLKSGRYFFVIIEGAQVGPELTTQLQKLPGVMDVQLESEEKIRSDLSTIVGKLDLELPDVLFQKTPQVYKMTLVEEMNQKAEGRLQDYIKKIVGPDFVTFSQTKDPTPMVRKLSAALDRINQVGKFPVFIILFGLWFFCFHFFAQVFFPRVFVVEHFQRKKRVGIKTLYILQGLGLFVGAIVALGLESSLQLVPLLQSLLLCILTPAIFWIGRKWSSVFSY